MNEILIRPITVEDLGQATGLLKLLNPDTPPDIVFERLGTILREHPHYHLVGAFDGETLAGVSGAWLATKIWCGLYLEVDNLVVAEAYRSAGIGSLLVSHLEDYARAKDCKVMVLDSYTANTASHRLYHRLGFEIWGFHFIKPIGDWKGDAR